VIVLGALNLQSPDLKNRFKKKKRVVKKWQEVKAMQEDIPIIIAYI